MFQTPSGWWFGTRILFLHLLGIMLPTDFHIFHRGMLLNHPAMNLARIFVLPWGTLDCRRRESQSKSSQAVAFYRGGPRVLQTAGSSPGDFSAKLFVKWGGCTKNKKGWYNWLVVWNMNFIFPYIGKNNPNWLIFFRGVETTNQIIINKHWSLGNRGSQRTESWQNRRSFMDFLVRNFGG